MPSFWYSVGCENASCCDWLMTTAVGGGITLLENDTEACCEDGLLEKPTLLVSSP